MKNIILFSAAFLAITVVHGQLNAPQFPTIGKPCPDITLHNIKYYKKTEANIKDFRGKWLMLDLWERFCGQCFQALPRRNKNRKEFAGKMEVIMVGIASSRDVSDMDNERKLAEDRFAQAVRKDTLDLPCAFNGELSVKWDIGAVPYVVIIDPKGIVRAITWTLPREKLDSLLNGFSPVFDPATRAHEDVGPEVRPSVGNILFTSIAAPDAHIGPRFAFGNDNDFPIIVNTDNINGWDTLASRQVGVFHEGDYRTALQVYNITYNLTYKKFRGKTNALYYAPKPLKGTAPTGDWIIHFKWNKNWNVKALKIEY